MNNRTFTLPIIIIAAIAVGVFLTVQRVNSPVMSRLVSQQNEILKMTNVIQTQVAQLQTKRPGSGPAGVVAGNVANPGDLQQRVEALEAKVDFLTRALQRGGAIVPAAQQQQRGARPQEDMDTEYPLSIGHSPVLGNPDAPITIYEFVDIQCPYCSRFHPVVNDVVAAYPDKVNYVMKNFPLNFHSMAKPAAKAALAAGEQGKYFEMLDLLLVHNRELSETKFKELAGQLKLDVEQFTRDLKEKDSQYEAWIKADMDLAVRSNVRGTPTFFLQKRKTNARNLASFKQEIDALLKKMK